MKAPWEEGEGNVIKCGRMDNCAGETEWFVDASRESGREWGGQRDLVRFPQRSCCYIGAQPSCVPHFNNVGDTCCTQRHVS